MIYAIDFGTTNSLLGAVIDGKMHAPIPLDPHAKDQTILRSVLYFPDRNKCFYGAEAIREYAKRDMEGRFIRSVKKFLPNRSFLGTQVGNRMVTIEEIVATFLRELRTRANQHFGKDVKSVLLGRPAQFAATEADDGFAQMRLERAAELAGFREIRFCPEPIAAAYDFRSTLKEAKIVLVADFGGGTSDFTVMKISKEKYQPTDVLSIGGVALAGDSLDGDYAKAHFFALRRRCTIQSPFGCKYPHDAEASDGAYLLACRYFAPPRARHSRIFQKCARLVARRQG
jgi:hypothetical chaperone protein